jgi:hypothetical protein
MSDHPRTILLQLWPQRIYTKQLRLTHETEKLEKGEKIKLTGLVKLPRRESPDIIFSEVYDKDSKSKVRAFYKKFLAIVENFIGEIDGKGEAKE